MRATFSILFLLLTTVAYTQLATVQGTVTDAQGNSIPGVNIYDTSKTIQTNPSDRNGRYSIKIPTDRKVTLIFSFVGYQKVEKTFELKPNESIIFNPKLKTGVDIGTAVIEGGGQRTQPIQRLDPKIATRIPSTRGTIEDLLLQAPVNFTSELSSQYNVRGGSFDENLVYVNDIQVYRPFLVRAGQQEGLSFPNPDMVESIEFSAGGFEAKYGDKMSSVLDIKYRRPTDFAGSFSASLLGGSFQLEDRSKNKVWSHNSGIRYRNNSYILGTLDTQGDYNPNYTDVQTYITFDPDTTGPWSFNFLGNYARNKYNYVPMTRETDVGNINEALRLTVYFEGQEVTQFQTFFGAFSTAYTTDVSRLQFIVSAFRTDESETFDILGQYFLDELERDLGSDEFGEVLTNRGVGSFLEHARNDLDATVLNFSHKGFKDFDYADHYLEWGVKVQQEIINDRLSEWTLIDSAGYNTPHPQDSIGYIDGDAQPDHQVILRDVIKSNEALSTTRITGFVQDTHDWENENGDRFTYNVGLRGHLWTFNNEFVGGPRAHFSWQPKWFYTPKTVLEGEDSIRRRDVVFKFASGMYYQPAFYREMRDISGGLNQDIKAQRSIHVVAGVDYIFQKWDRPFKFIGEIYYKDLNQLIPYEVENVRLRYYATNNAKGYATGVDLMLNGEFIEGIQSWLRASFLKTAEDLSDDFYYEYFNDEGKLIVPGFTLNDNAVDSNFVEPGFIPRPTDQRFNFSLLFQDEMPRWPEYKVLISMFYGTPLPFGPPSFERYKDVLRTSAYRRVDIGFSRDLVTKKSKEAGKLGWMKEGYVALEIFNILGINNTINYTWIEDVSGRQYAIPNFLTGRRINLKVAFKF
jgi:hypothetical protein